MICPFLYWIFRLCACVWIGNRLLAMYKNSSEFQNRQRCFASSGRHKLCTCFVFNFFIFFFFVCGGGGGYVAFHFVADGHSRLTIGKLTGGIRSFVKIRRHMATARWLPSMLCKSLRWISVSLSAHLVHLFLKRKSKYVERETGIFP